MTHILPSFIDHKSRYLYQIFKFSHLTGKKFKIFKYMPYMYSLGHLTGKTVWVTNLSPNAFCRTNPLNICESWIFMSIRNAAI